MLTVGALRERVTIRTFTVSVSSDGDQTETWADLVTSVPASVEPLQGRELYQAQAIQSNLAYRVTVRYRTDVKAKQRIVWNSQTLEIHGVANEGARDRFLVLQCSETT